MSEKAELASNKDPSNPIKIGTGCRFFSAIMPSPFFVPEVIISFFALLLQMGNVMYALQHALSKQFSIYNAMLVIAMFLYSFSFVPLIINSCIDGDPDMKPIVLALNLAYNCLFLLSTFTYVVVIQSRFQLVRMLRNYSRLWDIIPLVTTIAVFVIFGLGFGVVFPILHPEYTQSNKQILYVGIWTLYALLVDTTVSIVFFIELWKIRNQVVIAHDSEKEIQLNKTLVSLVSFFVATWVGVLICAYSGIGFADNPQLRRFVYRIGFSFSAFQFSGGVYFLFSINKLYAPVKNSESLKIDTKSP